MRERIILETLKNSSGYLNIDYFADKLGVSTRTIRNEIKKIETNISILETKINTLTEQLHSEEVLNDYQKYNQINDEISELENQLNTLMEEWEALQ